MSEEQAAPVASNKRDEPFRIRVSLQRFFSDERARCYLMVSSARSVRWLESRLRQEFSLPGAMCLLSAGYLLPRGETLALLRPDDSVDVIPVPASKGAQNGCGDEPPLPLDPPEPPIADEALLLRRNLSLTDTNGEEGEEVEEGEVDEADALQQSKRRALSLLSRLEGVADEPRRRRRRVHCRRRRPVPPALDPAPDPAPTPTATPTVTPTLGPDQVAPVLRGAGGASRNPRLVVPLREMSAPNQTRTH